MQRRTFLGSAVGLALPWLGTSFAQERIKEKQPAPLPKRSVESFPGMILREKEPENLEFPFATLDSFIVPNERFFIRNHFPVPMLETRTWRLSVEGAVQNRLELTYDDLTRMASRKQTATIECAGNGRGFLTPTAKGVLWDMGAVGNAEWTGVPLGAVLDKAGVRQEAVEVILEGADEGEIKHDPKSPGKIRFARSLPLVKARRPEVLLAYRMNDKELSPAHGSPLRAVVGGWYGMASIKWLSRIIVTDKPFQGFFQTFDYSYHERIAGLPSLVPITEMEVKAQIARPTRLEVVPANSTYRIHGAAWAGESEVTKVEISTDNGKSWENAKLLGKEVPFSWRLWEFEWKTPRQAGFVTLMARATDQRGRTQAMRHHPDRRAYRISHTLPMEVLVQG